MQMRRAPETTQYTQCLECDTSVKNRVLLKKHLKKHHTGLLFEDYVVKHEHGGVWPLCLCGCGEKVKFQGGVYFASLVRGHVTQNLRDACGDRFRGVVFTDERKADQSKRSLSFFASEKGKTVAAERAKKLNEFHASELGEQWSQEQSARLRAFNHSEAGLEKNASVSRKLKERRKTQRGKQEDEQRSRKVRAWNESKEGLNFRERRSREMHEFYQTPEGKDEIRRSAQKIREKNLMPIETVKEKLHVCEQKLELLTDIEKEYTGHATLIKTRCRTCGTESSRKFGLFMLSPRCFVCEPRTTISQESLRLAQALRDSGVELVVSDWNVLCNRELDIVMHSAKLAVEYNGLYWHSERNRSDHYHVTTKRQAAEERGYRLLTFFSDEWLNKPDIVMSMIRYRIGMHDRTIYARNTTLKSLSKDERKKFFRANHIAGDAKARYAFGLFTSDDEVVAAISLRKPLTAAYDGRYDVARFAVTLRTSVPGALSKLTKHALKQCKQDGMVGLVSYADARFAAKDALLSANYRFQRAKSTFYANAPETNRSDKFPASPRKMFR